MSINFFDIGDVFALVSQPRILRLMRQGGKI